MAIFLEVEKKKRWINIDSVKEIEQYEDKASQQVIVLHLEKESYKITNLSANSLLNSMRNGCYISLVAMGYKRLDKENPVTIEKIAVSKDRERKKQRSNRGKQRGKNTKKGESKESLQISNQPDKLSEDPVVSNQENDGTVSE